MGNNIFIEQMLDFLQKQRAGYEKRGLIPTLDLLIEDLEKSAQLNSHEDEVVGVGDAPQTNENHD